MAIVICLDKMIAVCMAASVVAIAAVVFSVGVANFFNFSFAKGLSISHFLFAAIAYEVIFVVMLKPFPYTATTTETTTAATAAATAATATATTAAATTTAATTTAATTASVKHL